MEHVKLCFRYESPALVSQQDDRLKLEDWEEQGSFADLDFMDPHEVVENILAAGFNYLSTEPSFRVL